MDAPKPNKIEVTPELRAAIIADLQAEFDRFDFSPMTRDQKPEVEWYEYGGVAAAVLAFIACIISATVK